MNVPWGMIHARREAEQYREDARQAQANEKMLLQSLVNLISVVEVTINDLQEVEASKPIRDKLQEAVNNARKGVTHSK